MSSNGAPDTPGPAGRAGLLVGDAVSMFAVGSLVAGDVMLAQKIALETDERSALLVAQPFPSSLPPRSELRSAG